MDTTVTDTTASTAPPLSLRGHHDARDYGVTVTHDLSAPQSYEQNQTQMTQLLRKRAAFLASSDSRIDYSDVIGNAEMFVKVRGQEGLHWLVGVEIDADGDLILITDGGAANPNR